jgi:hypothetical protein
MRVELKDISRGSCNFCDKGELNRYGNNLIYPYSEVVTVRSDGNGLEARFCKECLNELIEKSKKL